MLRRSGLRRSIVRELGLGVGVEPMEVVRLKDADGVHYYIVRAMDGTIWMAPNAADETLLVPIEMGSPWPPVEGDNCARFNPRLVPGKPDLATLTHPVKTARIVHRELTFPAPQS